MGNMANRKRDPGGYSLGPEQSVEVARRVRALLERNKAEGRTPGTQYELSKATEIPTSHLSTLLKLDAQARPRNFQGWQVKAMAKALGVEEKELLGGDGHLAAPAIATAGRPTIDYGSQEPGDQWVRQVLSGGQATLPPGLAEWFLQHGDVTLNVAKAMAGDRTLSSPDLVKDEAYWNRKRAYWENEFRIRAEAEARGKQGEGAGGAAGGEGRKDRGGSDRKR